MRQNRKIENSCIDFFASKTTVETKWHLSENLTVQNMLKNWKLLPAERYGNILTFDKESKRESVISADSFVKSNLNMNLGLKFLLCLNGNFFNFKKTPFRYYGGFKVAINAFLWNCE